MGKPTYRSHVDQSFHYDKIGSHQTQSPSYWRTGGIGGGKKNTKKGEWMRTESFLLTVSFKSRQMSSEVILLPLTVSARWWLFWRRSRPSFPSHLWESPSCPRSPKRRERSAWRGSRTFAGAWKIWHIGEKRSLHP